MSARPDPIFDPTQVDGIMRRIQRAWHENQERFVRQGQPPLTDADRRAFTQGYMNAMHDMEDPAMQALLRTAISTEKDTD